MRTPAKYLAILTFLLLLPASGAYAQTLTGTVRDNSGAVLPGVTVEASSPALAPRVVVTDGSGQYRIVELSPGTYTLTFTLPGFTTIRREGVELTGTQTLTIPIEMRVGGLEETITVTGETPVVDVQNVKRESVINADMIAAIPATRAYGSLLNATPGLTVDDNGLQATPTMTFFSARGGQNNEGRVTINGMAVAAAFNGGGVSSLTYDTNNVDEVSVVLAGGLGESDIGGPVMNLVPRAGGNNFRGQAFWNTAGDWSRGDNLNDELRGFGITQTPGIIGSYDASVSYGGPIKRDRLWFYGSYRKLDTTTAVEGRVANANAGDASRWDWAPDNNVVARQLQGRTMYIGRVTAQATQKNRISFNHEYQTRCEGTPLFVQTDGCHRREADWIGLGSAGQSPEAATTGGYFDFPYYVTQAMWTAPMTNKLLFEAGFTRFSYYHAGGPGQLSPDGIFDLISVQEQSAAINPATGIRYAPQTNYSYRAMATYQDNYGNPNNWRASASYVTGAHNMKVGYQGSFLRADATTVVPESQISYRFNQGVPNQFTFRLPTWERADRTNTFSLYVQDTWTRGRMTLQAALRYDRASSYSPSAHNGTAQTSQFNANPITFDRVTGVNAYNDITPRFGLAYDLFGNGRTAIKFNLGHYLDAATNDSIYTQNNPAARIVTSVSRNWTDTNGNKVVDCDIMNFAAQNAVDTCGELTGNNLNFGSVGNNLTQVDPALLGGWGVRENDWQWGVNVQQQLLPRISLEVGYNRRWWDGATLTDDLARNAEDYEAWEITAPLDPRLPGGGGYTIPMYTLLQSAANRPAQNIIRRESFYGNRKEFWQGVDVTWNARLRNGLTMQVGTSTGRKVTDRRDTVVKIDDPNPRNAYSKEPYQTTLRGLASYTIPKVDVQVSGTFRSQPPVNRTATWRLPNSVILETLGRLPPGAVLNGNTDIALFDNSLDGRLYADFRRTQIDMRVAKVLRFGSRRADIGLDLSNLLNTNYTTSFDNTYPYSVGNVDMGNTWNNPTQIYTPRFVRLNFTFNF